MRWLKSIAGEIYGLFVEDASFAAVLVVWMIVAVVALRALGAGRWGGPVLFVGLAASLAENTLRASRRAR